MSDKAEPSEALRQQLESDAGPFPTPDQERAAGKRRAAAGVESKDEARSAPPVQRKSVTDAKQKT